ncbi:uncharacterized protein LOC127755649 [Oryza glaberrima]|uniref:uncharacterized protein LOC127755649 n=1 Tax=Oryza glaberrima TaxID=4538 RepID=UPI00224C5162|nr:uncharacterized protein LOC127755649 [Oryza glaberrima]
MSYESPEDDDESGYVDPVGFTMSYEPPEDDVESGYVDPADLYTMDDFLAQQAHYNNVVSQVASNLQSLFLPSTSSAPRSTRRYIMRDREAHHAMIWNDYFSDNPVFTQQQFRRRYRMNKPLFLRIMNALSEWDTYFTHRVDALGRHGVSPLQKCTAVMRMLAYSACADETDEYCRIGGTTAYESLDRFCRGVIEIFGPEYLRKPTVDDVQRILQMHEERGFPGMLGSIDCMHWKWKNCPNGWKGMYTRGDYGTATIILEAVASRDRWIWHCFFGAAGSNNDINVLNQSNIFTNILMGTSTRVQFTVNGHEYNLGYYLADGIYPEWATLVKSIKHPQLEKDKLYAQRQESARKDVECAFGILKARFKVVATPTNLWKQAEISNIMTACIIMHNMIVEDEGHLGPLNVHEFEDDYEIEPPEHTIGTPVPMAVLIERDLAIHNRGMHNHLKQDLIEHIWERYGPH